MSDELDKTFALLQLERFNQVLSQMAERGVNVKYRHLCNSGGFLDLPQAISNGPDRMLPLGVYPSRFAAHSGLEPIMTVKARIAGIQNIQPNDVVGYAMRYQAPSPRRIAVIPSATATASPVRNQGCVLIGGRRAPIVGGVAMDAFMVDTTELPEIQMWDEWC